MITMLGLFTVKTAIVMLQVAVACLAIVNVASAAEPSGSSATVQSPVANADADDPAVAALTRPTSMLELGVGYVSQGDYKFGEYNGLQRRGPYAIGAFDIERRSPYDGDGTGYFRLQGYNLGLGTREVRVNGGMQGRFSVNFGYDELRRNSSDSI